MPYSSRRWPAISRVLIPRAYIETILSSKPGKRRWYLAISCGSKVDRRSRGTSRSIRPVSVSTVFLPYPLRLLPSSSPPRWWSISAFNARSASAFFSPSSRPFGSKAAFGSAPASSWSRIASGIRGSLRLGMSGLLRSYHARPHTKFPTGPRVPRPGAGHGRRLVPQAAEPPRLGPAADLGVRHHLPAPPDQLPLRPRLAAIHEDGRRLRRVRRRPGHRWRQGARHLGRARHTPVRPEMDVAEHDRPEPAGVDGRSQRPAGRPAYHAAGGPGDRVREGHDPLHPRRPGKRFRRAHRKTGRTQPDVAVKSSPPRPSPEAYRAAPAAGNVAAGDAPGSITTPAPWINQ